ncbi:hypothetical protein [Ferroglobus placidus]|nr:hypothetical protein [Ferroglobus placidus]
MVERMAGKRVKETQSEVKVGSAKVVVRGRIDPALVGRAVDVLTQLADEVILRRSNGDVEISLVFTKAEIVERLEEKEAESVGGVESAEGADEEVVEEVGKEERELLPPVVEGIEEKEIAAEEKKEEKAKAGDKEGAEWKKEEKKWEEKKEEEKEETVRETEGKKEKKEKKRKTERGEKGWIKKGNLIYRVSKDLVEARYKGHVLKLPYETARRIFDELPTVATAEDILSTAEKLEVKMNKVKAYMLAKVFTHVLFDATISGGGKRGEKMRIIKPEYFSLRSEVKNKIEQELEVIGRGF